MKETSWTLGTVPELDRALQDSTYGFGYTAESDDQNPAQVWAAHLPGKPPKIILSARYLPRDEDFTPLAQYLRRLAPESLIESLFALDSYHQCRLFDDSLPDPGSYDFTADPVVDEILASSKGILLWQFQLERLAQSLGLTRQDAIRLRRHVNQKRPSALNPVKEKTVPSGQTLHDVIGERLLYEGVVPGRWEGARRLFEARLEE